MEFNSSGMIFFLDHHQCVGLLMSVPAGGVGLK